MSSNYPPGVTGNEPQITGDYGSMVDPHAPFWIAPDVESPSGFGWCVYNGQDEDEFWNNLSEEQAKTLMAFLNTHYSLRDEQRAKDGHCRVCGDYHGDPEELYDRN